VKLTTQLYLEQRLRMGGALPPTPQYGFKACTGTNSSFPLFEVLSAMYYDYVKKKKPHPIIFRSTATSAE